MTKAVSLEAKKRSMEDASQTAAASSSVDRRRPAILPAAKAADLLAEHLAPSFGRTNSLDVVARKEVQSAIHFLDRLFVIEAQRYAFFQEDPIETEPDDLLLDSDQTDRLLAIFSHSGVSLMPSMKDMTDGALGWALSHGQKPIAWEEGVATERKIIVHERGGKLPVPYLTHAFELAMERLQRMLHRSAGLPLALAKNACCEISRSVAIEVIRAGSNAGERLETLATWCLQILPFDGKLVSRCIMRGAYFFLHALISAASGRPETEIRDICFDERFDELEAICRKCGLSPGYGSFIIRALRASKNFGNVATAAELADFAAKMAVWLERQVDQEEAPEDVLEIAVLSSDHLDWLDQSNPAGLFDPGIPNAQVISLEHFRRT